MTPASSQSAEAFALPEGVYDSHDYTSIHAAILFADIEHSVMISSALSPRDYDKLVNAFQRAMMTLVDALRQQNLFVSEYGIIGDQLSIFFYDPDEVRRNFLLDGPVELDSETRKTLVATCRHANEQLTFGALKAAIQLKNIWLTQDFSEERVREHRAPLNLGIGINMGQVFYTNRADGQRRIEGNTVNLGKRIESFSRSGKYSQIMFSQRARDTIRSSVIRHSQLRQRVFFHEHAPSLELMKGVAQQQHVYELKFYHRLGVPTQEMVFEQYGQMFLKERSNVWAYYQLFEYYAYQRDDWDHAFGLAKMAQLVHPVDEKIQLDLSKCYLRFGRLEQSMAFALRALELNPEFDLVHEHLAQIAVEQGDKAAQIRHLRGAILLSPDSPVNNFNLGLALLTGGQPDEGARCVLEAVRLFPGYPATAEFQAAMLSLREEGLLPAELDGLILSVGGAMARSSAA